MQWMFPSISILSASMSTWKIAGLAVLAFAALNLILLYPLLRLTAYIVFRSTMVRNSSAMWARGTTHDDPLSLQMSTEGTAWADAHADAKQDVHIVNDGLTLHGEYYDFGYDRAVILIPGRTDSLTYSYYYALPYQKQGYNVLCIDQRGHGLSEGKYVTLGYAEHRDVLGWARLLHDEWGIHSVVLHGICIGSACALYAMLADDRPDYLWGVVADGMYRDFSESYYLHMKELKKPTFILGMVDKCMQRHTGVSFKSGPGDVIHNYHGPLLMLHGTADKYSLPARTRVLYDRCPSEQKRLVWFDGGEHSKLRIAHTAAYDAAIGEFLRELHAAAPTHLIS
jgi:alpha-beta hydrolase superfamily lysophospholipase